MHLGDLLRRMANDHVAGIRRELDCLDRVNVDDEKRRPSRKRCWLILVAGVTVLLAQSIKFFVDLNDPFLLNQLRLAIKDISHAVPHNDQGFDRIKQSMKESLKRTSPAGLKTKILVPVLVRIFHVSCDPLLVRKGQWRKKRARKSIFSLLPLLEPSFFRFQKPQSSGYQTIPLSRKCG